MNAKFAPTISNFYHSENNNHGNWFSMPTNHLINSVRNYPILTKPSITLYLPLFVGFLGWCAFPHCIPYRPRPMLQFHRVGVLCNHSQNEVGDTYFIRPKPVTMNLLLNHTNLNWTLEMLNETKFFDSNMPVNLRRLCEFVAFPRMVTKNRKQASLNTFLLISISCDFEYVPRFFIYNILVALQV